MKLAVAIAAVAAIAGTERIASADQCQAVTKKQAELAKTRLTRAMNGYALFCAPCGDAKPRVGTAKSIEVKKSGKNYEVLIDGTSVDLAYVYTHDLADSKQAANLGLVVGCQAQGVPLTINMGAPRWEMTVPTPSDPFVRIDGSAAISVADSSALDGTWTAETVVAASTCPGDKLGAKSSSSWTITSTNGRVAVRSDSGLVLSGSLLVRAGGVRLMKDTAPSQAIFDLDLKDSKTLVGFQVAGQATGNKADPVCVTYRSFSATKVK